jgi:hypothetical protein
MSKRTRTQFLLIIVGTAFVGWRMLGIAQKYSPATALALSAAQSESAPDSAGQVERGFMSLPELPAAIASAQLAVEKKPWGRDPFDPTPFVNIPLPLPTVMETKAPVQAPPAPLVTFNGVSRKGARWLAAVDGGIIGVGDLVQDKYRVVGITNSSLTLVSEGWAFRYELGDKTGQVRPWRDNP